MTTKREKGERNYTKADSLKPGGVGKGGFLFNALKKRD